MAPVLLTYAFIGLTLSLLLYYFGVADKDLKRLRENDEIAVSLDGMNAFIGYDTVISAWVIIWCCAYIILWPVLIFQYLINK